MGSKSLIRLITFLFFFAAAIPWYWQFFPQTAVKVVLGFPLWVLTSIAGSALISCLTALSLYQFWPADEEAN